MTRLNTKASLCLTSLGIALALAANSTFADKPNWANDGKHKESKMRYEDKSRSVQNNNGDRRNTSIAFTFGIEDRRIASEYYAAELRKGKCPPGLAKKNNGCQPPGLAKKWQRGQPLARDIRYYELPNALQLRLPAPPPNHRYVQVAGDILLIAVGSSIVVDAIEDILR